VEKNPGVKGIIGSIQRLLALRSGMRTEDVSISCVENRRARMYGDYA
jgi:hypothetical protein